jgi:hypothetical protein
MSWLTVSGFLDGPAPVSELSIIERPSVPAYSGSNVIPPERLATTRHWYAIGTPQYLIGLPGGDRHGDWEILDRLPALERLWLDGPQVTKEGWRRIGEHPALEVLSLRNVWSGYSSGDGDFARDGRDALARLPRLRSLELYRLDLSSKFPGRDLGVLLPPLPALETCSIGPLNLEANLRTLADGSPALQRLAVVTGPDTPFTPAMIDAVRMMSHLRELSVVACDQGYGIDEAATRRQVAEVAAAVPGVRVRPGFYEPNLWRKVSRAAFVWPLAVSLFFWFGVSTLLATPLGWMLPGRLSAHLFWLIAASIVACAAFVALCLQLGVDWLRAVAVAASAVAVASFVVRDIVKYMGFLALVSMVSNFVVPRSRVEHWLIEGDSVAAIGMLIAATAVIATHLRRLADKPRILAEQGREVPFGLVADASQLQPPERRRWLGSIGDLFADATIDRQIAKPPPAGITTAVCFAEMLRRPQSRLPVLVVAGLTVAVPLVILGFAMPDRGQPSLRAKLQIFAMLPATAASLSMLARAWFRRRSSAAVDFLRPVSRPAYWQGLCRATARDLVVPVTVVAYGLVVLLWCEVRGQWLPWIPAMLGFIGFVAMAQAMLIVAATSRRAVTILIVAAGVCAAYVTMLFSVATAMDEVQGRMVGRRLDPILVAGAVLVVGLAIRAAVLWKVEDREIG